MSNKKIQKFEDLRVWELSHKLTLDIYKLTSKFPKYEQYGLTSQLKRASSSVPSNIVEGYYRKTKKEFTRFLYIARGSSGEVIYLLILSHDLKYISKTKFLHLRNDYEKLTASLSALIKSLNKK